MSLQLGALPNPRVSLQRPATTHPQDPLSMGGSFFDTTTSTAAFFWIGGNPQQHSWTAALDSALAHAPAGCTLLCWSGTFADELFAGDVRNWTRPGKPALEGWLDQTLAHLAAHGSGHKLGVIAHHTHLLSDVSAQMRLWHARRDQGIATILHPAALIAPSMLRDLNDHLTRTISMVAPRCDLCILEDIAPLPTEGDEESVLARVSWETGLMAVTAHELVHGLLRDHLPPTTPILLSEHPFFC
ncbi:MAG: hypothetical protein EXS17_07515 [Phycisphaerales bacterium]|nr:hypothetical protein [Phycisphaerales bacterium]